MTALGRNPPPVDATDASRLRQLLSDAEAGLREAEEELKNAQQDLEDLFKPERFGKNGEWKKLDKLCLEKDTGEYVLPTVPRIQLFTFHQIHVRGLPLWGGKAKGKIW